MNSTSLTSLRIVTNGKKFRLQSSEKIERNRHLYNYDLKEIHSIIFGRRLVFRNDKATENYDNWYFLNKDGQRSYDITSIIEFNSKNAAIKWIKSKFGQDVLNKLNKKQEQWTEV